MKRRKGNRQRIRERNHRLLQHRKRRLLNRIAQLPESESDVAVMTASNIHYELADRAP
jgi:hypothetical protein